MPTTIVNIRKKKCDILICRGSIWGNPFIIGRDGDRDECVDKYELWLPKQKFLMSQIYTLKDQILGCYCKPKRCHGDILVKLANALE